MEAFQGNKLKLVTTTRVCVYSCEFPVPEWSKTSLHRFNLDFFSDYCFDVVDSNKTTLFVEIYPNLHKVLAEDVNDGKLLAALNLISVNGKLLKNSKKRQRNEHGTDGL
jgi:hypothetical protein